MSSSAVTISNTRRSRRSAETALFFRLAEMLAGPVSPAKLRKTLRICVETLDVSQLDLCRWYPDSFELACLATASANTQEISFAEVRRTPPQPVTDFLSDVEVSWQIAEDRATAAFFGRDQALLLLRLPIESEERGLLVLDAKSDQWSPALRDAAELLLAATLHCIDDSNKRALADSLTEVLNFSDSIYASWHENTGWHYHNVNGLIQLGYRKSDINLRSVEAHNPMHPDDWREGYELFEKTLRHGVGYQQDYRALGVDNGECHWYHADVTVTEKNANGGARELVSISRDITGVRTAAKEAVERATLEKWLVTKAKDIFSCNDFESLRTVLQEVGSYLGVDHCTLRVVDPETLYCNLVAEWHRPHRKAIAELFPEVTSQTGVGWIGRLIALGKAYVVNSFIAEVPNKKILDYHRAINADACITQPMIYGNELTGYLALLSEQPREWTDTELRVAKEIAEAIHMAILRNRLLDELRATDERFQLAMESSTHGLWEYNARGQTMYFSPHFYEMLGYPRVDHPIPMEEMLNKYVDSADHKVLFEETKRQYTNKENEVRLELRHRKRDGSLVWMLSRGKVIERDAQKRPLRIVGVNMDITEQKRILDELSEARAKSEMANRSKSEFLERMSHEIRTPMNAIVGMSYLTLQTELDQDQKVYLQDIDGAAKSLLHIINDILDFSKIESGELTVVSERFNLKQELQRVVKLMSVRAAQGHNQLKHTIADNVPEYVVGDKHRLGQVLINLLGNATKFTKNGQVSLSVRCSDQDARINSLTLLFSVSDSGIGLTKSQIDTLFEPFVQAEGSTTRKYGGTGLGLSISKHLVEMMGGSIRCSSSPDVGTTFDFTVTFKQQIAGAAASAPADKNGRKNPLSPHTAPQRMRVLVAEDNLVNQRVAKGILTRFNIDVVTAINGKEALDLLETEGPEAFNAVLMDIEMPVMDGLTAARAIRRQPQFRGLPVIAMTAHAMMGDRERCLAAGMDDHIAKPVNPDNVLQVLARLWGEDEWLQQYRGKG